jgi:hypothetical protein
MTNLGEDDEMKNDTPAMGQGHNEDEDEESEEAEEAPVQHPYMKMFDAEILREFLGKSWVVFSVFFGLYYLLQFGLALMCANFYSQSYPLRLQEWKYTPVDPTKTDIVAKTNEPLRVCGLEGIEDNGKSYDANRAISAEIYDKAFFLLGMFHIIEWIRTIILLTSTCMGGVFLIRIWKLSMLNAIFGFVAAVFAHYAYFSDPG